MKKRLFELIADELLSRIKRDATYAMPSIRVLSREFRVSNITMGKAVHLLAEKGIIRCVHGKRISVHRAGDGTGRGAEPSSSEKELFGLLRQGILNGVYSPGDPMPKISFFVMARHVSPDTVVQVFAMLREENLIHKQGKKWIVGPAAKTSDIITAPNASNQAPVVLLIAYDQYDWISFFEYPHPRPFAIAFNSEISRYNVRLQLFLLETRRKAETRMLQGTAYASMHDLKSTIASLGSRYYGTLFICRSEKIDHALPWIEELCRFKKPVLYFDDTDQAADQTVPLVQKHASFYRMHMHEKGAVKLAIDALTDAGHRSILVPNLERRSTWWVTNRIRLIQECAGVTDRPVEIHAGQTGNDLMNMEHPASIHYFISAIESRLTRKDKPESVAGVQGAVSRRHLLLKEAPELVAFLRAHPATSVIALNDSVARQLFYWFRAVGVQIPGDISMVSFDNVPESITFPVATIDFGFSALGFQAAHILLQDLPYVSRTHRNIPTAPRILDRGSIAAPGRGIPPRLLAAGE